MTKMLVTIILVALLQLTGAETSSRFELPITVSNLPESSDFLMIEVDLAFSSIVGSNSIVDERSLELLDLSRRQSIAYQFTSREKQRLPQRQLPAGTSTAVSFASEFAVTNTPAHLQPNGRLVWLTSTRKAETSKRFLLRFAAPSHGTFVQVPFPPQNALHFDAANRLSKPKWFPEMQLRPQWPFEGKVDVFNPGGLIASYRVGPALSEENPQLRRPFVHPLNGPGGISLTEFGKPHDPTGSHAHHYGLWIAHASVNGKDFWGERGGTIRHERLELMEDGPVFARIIQRTRWLFEKTEYLHERRTFTFYNTPEDRRVIDVELEFTPPSTAPVLFRKSSFGFLAARVAQCMTVFDGAGEITNSEGQINEHNAHLQRARWIDQSGPIQAHRWAGITIFDLPENLNHPTTFHCRNDGWACASFSYDKPHELAAGAVLKLKYRLLLHAGSARDAQLEKRFVEFSVTPHVEIGTLKPMRN